MGQRVERAGFSLDLDRHAQAWGAIESDDAVREPAPPETLLRANSTFIHLDRNC